MSLLRIHKVSALPQSLTPNTIYVVNPQNRPDQVEIYITSNDEPPSVKRVLNESDVLNLINNQLTQFNNIHVVNNITERDNLNPTRNIVVLVIDATGDPTVTSGSATYVYRVDTQEWIKIAEWESLDVTITWNNIQGRPQSSPADIDDAVTKRHTHTNKTTLDKLTEDTEGRLMFNGNYVMMWETVEW